MTKMRFERGYVPARAAAYPSVGDQLDAIMKALRSLTEQGVSLPAETMAVIEACTAVKATYKKPSAISKDAL